MVGEILRPFSRNTTSISVTSAPTASKVSSGASACQSISGRTKSACWRNPSIGLRAANMGQFPEAISAFASILSSVPSRSMSKHSTPSSDSRQPSSTIFRQLASASEPGSRS